MEVVFERINLAGNVRQLAARHRRACPARRKFSPVYSIITLFHITVAYLPVPLMFDVIPPNTCLTFLTVCAILPSSGELPLWSFADAAPPRGDGYMMVSTLRPLPPDAAHPREGMSTAGG